MKAEVICLPQDQAQGGFRLSVHYLFFMINAGGALRRVKSLCLCSKKKIRIIKGVHHKNKFGTASTVLRLKQNLLHSLLLGGESKRAAATVVVLVVSLEVECPCRRPLG